MKHVTLYIYNMKHVTLYIYNMKHYISLHVYVICLYNKLIVKREFMH